MSNSSAEVVVSIAEAARRLGVTPDAVCKHINQGQLRTRRLDHTKGLHVVLPDRPEESAPSSPSETALAVAELRAAVAALQEALADHEARTGAALCDALIQLGLRDQHLAERDRHIAELCMLVTASHTRAKQGLIRRLWHILLGRES